MIMNSDVLQEKKNENSCVYVEQRESNTILAIVASLQRSEFRYSSSLTVFFGLFVPYYHVLEHPRLCLRYCSPYTALFPLPSRIDRSRLYVRDTFLSNKRFLLRSYEYHRRVNVELYLHSCIRVNYLLAPAAVLDTRFTGMLFSMSNVRWTTEHRTLVDFSQPPSLFFFLYSRKLFIRSFAFTHSRTLPSSFDSSIVIVRIRQSTKLLTQTGSKIFVRRCKVQRRCTSNSRASAPFVRHGVLFSLKVRSRNR